VWLFAKIAVSSFGGWATTAVFIKKEMIKKRQILTQEDLDVAIGYTQMLPGAAQIILVTSVGYRLRGSKGASLAMLSYLVIPLLLIAGFTVTYFRFLHDSPNLMNQLDGVIAALGGVILANAYRIGNRYATRLWLWLMVGVALFARLQFNVSPLFIIVAYALGGLMTAFIVLPSRRHQIANQQSESLQQAAETSTGGEQ
jgi:chromate transporter